MSQTETITAPAAAAIEMSELKRDQVTSDPVEASHTASSVQSQDRKKKRGNVQIAAIVMALNLALFVTALNDTVVANAIPTICKDLNSAAGYVWIGGAQSLAKAASTPLWAKFSDIWGRKPLLLAAITWFLCASAISGWAVSMNMLIAGRVLQGIGGGGIFGLVMIAISDIFSVRTRTLFFGIMSVTWAIAGAIGPILGGAFTELATWRWCFWIMLPTAGLAIVLLALFLDVHRPHTPMAEGLKAIDWLGSLSIVGMVLMILLGLDFGGVIFPWSSPKVICLFVFGAVCGVFLYASERWVAKYPIIPIRIISNRHNAACLLVSALQGFVFVGPDYYLPLYFQGARELTPLKSGILTIPLTIMEAVAAISAGVLVHRLGRYREPIWAATFVMTLGTGLYINMKATSPLIAVVAPQLVAALGVGFLFDPPLVALQANIAQEDVASASAAFGTLGSIASAVSIVVGGVVFQNGMSKQKTSLAAAGLPSDFVENLGSASAAANVDLIAHISDPDQKLAARNAVAASMRNMWILYTVFSFVAFAASLFMKKYVLSKEHTETKTGLKKEQ